MAYDDEQARRSRVVVETPTSRREVTQTESVRNDRGGVSGATVGIIVVVAIALITIVVLFLMNGQSTDTTNANLAEQQPVAQQPVIVQQPAQQQPPVIIQQPAPAGQPPVVINQPAPAGGSAPVNNSNDGAVQTAIDKKISDDPNLSSLGITATVLDGKVTVTGTVKSEALKSQIDRMLRTIRGVKQVDNQIVVMS
ncbi:MAG TPA: BON domain-containing protein [Pyrinomonadaceae bacterium]|nr:BON domain-containing protein [Pyrinomonadaceae bacterium]